LRAVFFAADFFAAVFFAAAFMPTLRARAAATTSSKMRQVSRCAASCREPPPVRVSAPA